METIAHGEKETEAVGDGGTSEISWKQNSTGDMGPEFTGSSYL